MSPTETTRELIRLDAGIAYVRTLLERRIQWLRTQWRQDPLSEHRLALTSDARADALLAMQHNLEHQFYEGEEMVSLASSARQLRDAFFGEADSRMAVLSRLFHLSDLECDILWLAAAPEFDPALGILYGYAQDDAGARWLTPHLASALLLAPNTCTTELWQSVSPGSPLLRFNLLLQESGSAPPGGRPLRADDRVIRLLQGINRIDDRIAPLLSTLPEGPVPDTQRETFAKLLEYFQDGMPEWRLLQIVAGENAGADTFVRNLCERMGVAVWKLDCKPLSTPGPAREEILRLLDRDAVLSQFVVYIDSGACENQDFDWLGRLSIFAVISSREGWASPRPAFTASLQEITSTAARGMWEDVFRGFGMDPPSGCEQICEQFEFSPSSIVQAASAAIQQTVMASRPSVDFPTLWRACRMRAGRTIEGMVQRIDPHYTWDDLVLPADALLQLHDLAAQVAQRHRVYSEWGYGAKLSRGRGITALFSGPSGTGKTMAAEVVAEELKLDLYRIDLASTVSKYIGETEKNLKRLFDSAEQGGAILFFDEADALFGKRTEVKDSHDRYANIEVNYLLQRMEDYRGLAILATNRKSVLDRAFLRRLRFVVDFPFPDVESREHLWRKSVMASAPCDELDFAALARLEIAGGNIRNIVLNAAFLAAADGKPLNMTNLSLAARREFAKIEQDFRESDLSPHGGRR